MKCKSENDGRKRDKSTKEFIRMQIVKSVKDGFAIKLISKMFGVSERHVYRVMETYLEGGQNALKSKATPGRPPKLNAEKIEWLVMAIREKTPLQFKFSFALWTLRTIQQIVRTELEVELSISAVRKLMKNLGFTPQKPRYMAWQQDDALVQSWHDETFPNIQAQAKACGATIFLGDEAGIRSSDHLGRTWAPIGQTPILNATGERFGVNLISAVGANGQFEFMLHDGMVTADVFVKFLERLMTGRAEPVFLILDNCSIHHAKVVKEYVTSLKGNLTLFYLPPYSPQLNPDEQVWAHVKREVTAQLPSNKLHLQVLVNAALDRLKSLPALIKSFFRHPECALLIE